MEKIILDSLQTGSPLAILFIIWKIAELVLKNKKADSLSRTDLENIFLDAHKKANPVCLTETKFLELNSGTDRKISEIHKIVTKENIEGRPMVYCKTECAADLADIKKTLNNIKFE